MSLNPHRKTNDKKAQLLEPWSDPMKIVRLEKGFDESGMWEKITRNNGKIETKRHPKIKKPEKLKDDTQTNPDKQVKNLSENTNDSVERVFVKQENVVTVARPNNGMELTQTTEKRIVFVKNTANVNAQPSQDTVGKAKKIQFISNGVPLSTSEAQTLSQNLLSGKEAQASQKIVFQKPELSKRITFKPADKAAEQKGRISFLPKEGQYSIDNQMVANLNRAIVSPTEVVKSPLVFDIRKDGQIEAAKPEDDTQNSPKGWTKGASNDAKAPSPKGEKASSPVASGAKISNGPAMSSGIGPR